VLHSRADSEIEFARLAAFSDGVIAIAITLLVLNIDVPQVPADELPGALADQWRTYLAFALSFALIGRFWIVHHRTFSVIERFGGTLMALNLVFLALIVAMPFSTDLVADYGDDSSPAVVIYGLTVGLAAVVNLLMLRRAAREGHLRAGSDALVAEWTDRWSLAPMVVFLASVPVAFLSTLTAQLMWILSFAPLVGRTSGGLRRRRG
jgi:uncharacterized membrane protein